MTGSLAALNGWRPVCLRVALSISRFQVYSTALHCTTYPTLDMSAFAEGYEGRDSPALCLPLHTQYRRRANTDNV